MNPGTRQYLGNWRRRSQHGKPSELEANKSGFFFGNQVKNILEKRKKEAAVSNVDERGSEMVFVQVESLSDVHRSGFGGAVRTKSLLEWVERRR